MVMLLTLLVPVIILKYSKYLMLTDSGLNINVRVLSDTDGGTIGSTSCSKGRMTALGQGLCFAPGIYLQCIKGLLIRLKRF